MNEKDRQNVYLYQNDWLHKYQNPNAIIKPVVCNIIWENFLGNSIKTVDAMKVFKLSHFQFQRIKAEDPNLVRGHKKHPIQLNDEMKTNFIQKPDQKSLKTLAETECFINKWFNFQV